MHYVMTGETTIFDEEIEKESDEGKTKATKTTTILGDASCSIAGLMTTWRRRCAHENKHYCIMFQSSPLLSYLEKVEKQ